MSIFRSITDNNKSNFSLTVLIILHAVGLVGMLTPFKPWVVALTPVHLIVSTVLLLWGVGFKTSSFKGWFIQVLFIGYLVELAGVKTGVIFGSYRYGETLGYLLFDVPVIIGLNWFLVSYGSYALVARLPWSDFLKIISAALICVGLDILIEPVAVSLNYWQWDGDIPLRNYLGWFLVSVLIQFLAIKGVKNPIPPHKLAVWLLLIQFMFFLILNLFAL